MTDPTAYQLSLLEHALGLPRCTPAQRRRYRRLENCYRNHFVAGADHRDWRDLVALQVSGLMQRRDVPIPCGPDSALFFVTEAGFEALRAHGRVPPVQRELFARRSG